MSDQGNGSEQRVPTMSAGTVTAYGLGRERKWKWSARVFINSTSTQYRRAGFATREAALADRDRVLAEVRNPGSTSSVAAQTMTLAQAFERYWLARSTRKTMREARRVAGHIIAHFGANTPLRAITPSKIAEWRDGMRAGTSKRTGRPLKGSSINRPLSLLRALLYLAFEEWEVLRERPRFPDLEDEGQHRLRWLTREEATRLVAAAREARNPELEHLITLALFTGMRQSELLGLEWERVDRSRGVILLEVTKSGKRREVPLNAQADAVLVRLGPRASGRVFTSRSWETYRSAWKHAVNRAKLDAPATFHDLRHTFASWAIQRRVTLLELRDLLGHHSLTMVQRYAHLAPDHLRAATAVLDDVDLTGHTPTPATAREPAPTK
jgi:integrase